MQRLLGRKKLLIISGPTACGKTTFRESVHIDQRPELTQMILDKAFSRDSSCIKTLRMKGLRRRFYNGKGFQGLTKNCFNFLFELDTTGPLMTQNLILFPTLLKEFDTIVVAHNYVPIDVWIERIKERRLAGFKTSEYVNKIITLQESSAEKSISNRVYCRDCYSNFERFFNGLGVKDQLCINTIESVALARPFPFD